MLTTGRPQTRLPYLLLLLLALAPLIQRPSQPRQSFQHDLPRPVPGPHAVSIEARWVAAAAGDEVRVYELATGKPVTVIPCQAAHTALFLKNRLLVAGAHYAELYETPSFKRVWTFRTPVHMATASHNGSLVVLAQNRPDENNLTVHMLNSKGEVIWRFNGVGMSVKDLEAGSDGRFLVIHWATPADVFYLYNPWQKRFLAEGCGRAALHAGFLSQLCRGKLRVVDLDRQLLTGPVECPEKGLQFSPDGDSVLTGGQVWRAEDLRKSGAWKGPGQSQFCGTSEQVVTWQPNGQATVWSAADGQPLTGQFEAVPHAVAVAGTSRRLAAAGGERLKVWEW